MTLLVPQKAEMPESGEPFPELGETLESLRQFLSAAAGWVCLRDATGALTFPVRRGEIAEGWLRGQQARDNVWGFAVREGPTLLNDLRPWAVLGEPPLQNLLSCPLGEGTSISGHVALVNKPQGFASQDAVVLQGMAYHMGRLLSRRPAGSRAALELSGQWKRILDRSNQGILILDDAGTLVHANAAWLEWTGFAAEELLGRQAPFPFWVSQHDLVRAMSMASAVPASALPFRRRDLSLFWCQVETVAEECDGRPVTVAFLQQTSALAPQASVSDQPADRPPVIGELPFGLALTDGQGQLLWDNDALRRLLPGVAPGQPLHASLAPAAAAVCEHLLGELAGAEPGRMGSLVLGIGNNPLSLFWLTVRLPEGAGILFALTKEPDGFSITDPSGLNLPQSLSYPTPDWLALLLDADADIEGWGPRWEKLTGLEACDVEDSPCELVLDWLFPQQIHRERVADCLHQPLPAGCQIILDVATPVGSRPLLCTFLPFPASESSAMSPRRWLLLVGEPELFSGPGTPSWGFVRQFAHGLRQVLLHYLRPIGGSARLALARSDLPQEVTDWFRAIDAGCRGIDTLLDDLEHLSLRTAGERRIVSMAELVRKFFDEQTGGRLRRDYQLHLDLPEGAAPVRVNPRLLEVVLRQLLTNAEQALSNGLRRIEVRVLVSGDTVRCEMCDSGEGLPIDDWTRLLVPFFSTKGVFASDPYHAALAATGLGLTVCRHLLVLHQGQLELRSVPGEGTTAIIILPRADNAGAESRAATALGDTVRSDSSNLPGGPHLLSERSAPAPLPSSS